MLIGREYKKWLLIGALAMLTPVLSLAQHSNGRDREPKRECNPHERGCQQVPDGGSAATYLLAVGATCLGAMVVRSRFGKRRVS
jgi:hypothetical protein